MSSQLVNRILVTAAYHIAVSSALLFSFLPASPAAAQTPEKTVATSPGTDYSAIATLEVADSVRLTPEQRIAVGQIISERDAALAAAEEPQKNAISAAANDKLQALLTTDQQRLFVSLFTGKTLRFNFRNQKWAEVLDWISKEADLSLVMETPPPGTFSYSDSKDYTTTESIDLLNGWLLTKGFTLVRRERMLMCLDLKGGLPEGTIPRVSIEELATRGRYEFISALIPLEGRPAESVLLEVKPLLGSFGKAEALAQTQQLLVFDTAANLRVIEQIVQKVPIPQKPVVPPVVEPPKPVLTVYPIEHANPVQAGEVLKTIVAGTVVVDEKARQISINAIPAEQEKAKTILGQLESNQGPGMQPKLQLYPVQVSDAEQMLATLKLIAPDGTYRVDPISGQLVAWASETDQNHIRESLQMIQSEQPQGGGRQLQVYALKNADPVAVSTILVTVVPTARLTINATTRSLIAVGTLSDHEAIRALVEQLEMQAESLDTAKILKTYPLEPKTSSTTIITLLATLAPRASLTPDEVNRRLLVTASDKEHQLISDVIQQVQMESVGVQPELKFYSLTKVSGTTALPVLQSIVPLAKITFQPEGNRYSVIANADDHRAFASTLEKLEENAATVQRSLKFYDVDEVGSTDARTLLTSTYPDVTFVPTAEGNKLMAWVTPSHHEQIMATLEQLSIEHPFEATRTLKLYSITDLGPTASTVLSQSVPKATITAGARADQLAIVATNSDHEKLKQILEQLEMNKSRPAQKELMVYQIKGVTPASVLQVLQPLVDADVQLTADATGQQLFVRALPDKQMQIKAVIEQVMASLAAKGSRTTKTYVIGAPNADEAQEVLLALYPDAKIVTDADRKMIVATATEEQHVMIEQISSQMKGTSLDEDKPVPAVYSLKNVSATEVQTLLSSMYSRFDNVRLSVNEKTGRLVVLARKEQQDAIQPLIEQLDRTPDAVSGHELAVFRMNRLDSLAVQQALQPLLPKNAQVTADRIGRQLFVSASADEMPAIREMVQQMVSSQNSTEGLETRSYRLRPYEADEAQEVLERLMPDATLVTDISQELLVATATPVQHETIADIVEQMTSTAGNEHSPQARTYLLRTADGENAVDVLDTLFTRSDNVRLSFDDKTRSLIAVARPEQHSIIQKLVEQLEPAGTAVEPRTLEIYALPSIDGLTAVEMAKGVLQSIDPSATVSWEKGSKQLIVSTTSSGQKEVKAAVDRFADTDPREMDVIQLRMLSASSAQNAIEGLYGDSFSRSGDYPVIQADEDSQQLLIRGSKKQLQDIRTLLSKMGESDLLTSSTPDAPTNPNLRIVPIPGDTETILRKIEDLWPRVRRNPIRILRPESQQSPAAPVPNANGQFSIPVEPLNTDEKVQPVADAAASDTQEKVHTGENTAADPSVTNDENRVTPPGEPAPIIIIPGTGRVTIASDDIDALDQLESILRATTSSSPRSALNRNRDFSIYQLRNAGAEDVAETLESIYTSKAGTLAFGSVVIVPETRMNALIVYGGRTDRDRIEQLLEVLDTEKVPDSGRIFKTQVISLVHADAARIETVLKGVYRTEMTAGGSRRSIEIPAGLDTSVASMLRQINAAASAPLLTIEVQVETNSLVVKAPQNLLEELSELITQLDETASTNRARGVTLIPLKQTNSKRVMKILNDVLD